MFTGAVMTGIANKAVNDISNDARKNKRGGGGGGVFWIGRDGNVWVRGAQGTHSAGRADGNTLKYWSSRGFSQIADPVARTAGVSQGGASRVYRSGGGGGASWAGGGSTPKELDWAQLKSLETQLNQSDIARDRSKEKSRAQWMARLNEKDEEKRRETDKKNAKTRTTMQDFNEAKNTTDLDARNTLNNLISAVSTMGVGGREELVRQILGSANRANRKANLTLAKNRQDIDSAYNTYLAGNDNDIKKINDQYSYDLGEANRKNAIERRNLLYKQADVYGNADKQAERNQKMAEADSLSSLIANASAINPQYDGKTRTMATPELENYTASIGTFTPAQIAAGSDAAATAGTPAVSVNAESDSDKDYGVKKRIEKGYTYGV